MEGKSETQAEKKVKIKDRQTDRQTDKQADRHIMIHGATLSETERETFPGWILFFFQLTSTGPQQRPFFQAFIKQNPASFTLTGC